MSGGPSKIATVYDGRGSLNFLSAYSRWAAGGDYIGMATDARGVFAPLWPDASSGTFLIYGIVDE